MTFVSFVVVAGSNLAALACVGLWICLLLGAIGRHSWSGDLLSHFRVQYAVLFLFCAVVLLLTDKPPFAVVALAGLAVTAWSVLAYALTPRVSVSPRTLRVASFNVWYLNADLQPAAAWFEASGVDVILAQELTGERAAEFGKLLPSYPQVLAGEDWRSDAVVYSRLPITGGQLLRLVPGGARAAVVILKAGNRNVHIASVHLRWPMGAENAAMRSAELDSLAAFAKNLNEPLIVGGDFNLTPWSPHYRRFVVASGLQDCARGHGLRPTWPSWARLIGIRIDHCFLSRHVTAVAVRTGPNLGSDHLPMIVDLAIE